MRCQIWSVSVTSLAPGQNVADAAVDPETYEVRADGVLCDAPPATHVPLGRNYYIY